MPSDIFADVTTGVVLANGVIRISLGRYVAGDQVEHAGTILVPGNQAPVFLKQITDNINEIGAKIREKQSADLAEKAVANIGDGNGASIDEGQEDKGS